MSFADDRVGDDVRCERHRSGETISNTVLSPERVVALVDLARLAVERAGLDVMQLAQRSLGLMGFLRPHPAERLSRDLATYLRQPGPDRALTAAAEEILSAGSTLARVRRLRACAPALHHETNPSPAMARSVR